jgi:hypothetical protein
VRVRVGVRVIRIWVRFRVGARFNFLGIAKQTRHNIVAFSLRLSVLSCPCLCRCWVWS